jgi:hypothetical protein
MIKWEQLVFEGNPQYGVELQPIDFAAVAMACGIAGFSVDDPAEVPTVMEQAFAHPGPALVQATIDAIIKDAQDGTIDGNWTAAQVRAALAFIQNDPLSQQYSNLENQLEDYLASLQAPGEQSGQLAFTGGEIFVILAAGAALIGGGALLRRAHA